MARRFPPIEPTADRLSANLPPSRPSCSSDEWLWFAFFAVIGGILMIEIAYIVWVGLELLHDSAIRNAAEAAVKGAM